MTSFLCVVDFAGEPVRQADLAPGIARTQFDGDVLDVAQPQPSVLLASAGAPGSGAQVARGADHMVVFAGILTERSRIEQELERAGCAVTGEEADIDLVLAACLRWGDEAISHLSGEFSGAFWDASRWRLVGFCDHLSIRTLYHARVGQTAFLSSELLAIPAIAPTCKELDDDYVADFLLFGSGLRFDHTATAFAEVSRLERGNLVVMDPAGQSTRRYWDFPVDTSVDWSISTPDAVREFRETLDQCVLDRLDSVGGASLMLSGGMDSGAIAASVSAVGRTGDVACLTASYNEPPLADDEAAFADLTARACGLHVQHVSLDSYGPLRPLTTFAEPAPAYRTGLQRDLDDLMASMGGGLAIVGHGGDELLPWTRLHQVLLRQSVPDAARTYARLWLRNRERPSLGGARRYVRQLLTGGPPEPDAPAPYAKASWLAANLETPVSSDERWSKGLLERTRYDASGMHPMHPELFGALRHAAWPTGYEYMHKPATRPPRYSLPLVDRRLIELVARFPPGPLFHNKHVLRAANAGRLPPKVLTRRKTLAVPFQTAMVGSPAAAWLSPWRPRSEAIHRFVDVAHMPELVGADQRTAVPAMRPVFLDQWLLDLESL